MEKPRGRVGSRLLRFVILAVAFAGLFLFDRSIKPDQDVRLEWMGEKGRVTFRHGELFLVEHSLVLFRARNDGKEGLDARVRPDPGARIALFYQASENGDGEAVLLRGAGEEPEMLSYREGAITERRRCKGKWEEGHPLIFAMEQGIWKLDFGAVTMCEGSAVDPGRAFVGLGSLRGRARIPMLAIGARQIVAPSFVLPRTLLCALLAGLAIALVLRRGKKGALRPAILASLPIAALAAPTVNGTPIYLLGLLYGFWPALIWIRNRVGRSVLVSGPRIAWLLLVCAALSAAYATIQGALSRRGDRLDEPLPARELDPLHPLVIDSVPRSMRLAFDLILPEGGILEAKLFARLLPHPLDGIVEDSPGSGLALFASSVPAIPSQWVTYSPLRSRIVDLACLRLVPGERHRVEILTNGIEHEVRIDGRQVHRSIGTASWAGRGITISTSRAGTRIENGVLAPVPGDWGSPCGSAARLSLSILSFSWILLLAVSSLQHGFPRGWDWRGWRKWGGRRVHGGYALAMLLALTAALEPQAVPVAALGFTMPDVIEPRYYLLTILSLAASWLCVPRERFGSRGKRVLAFWILVPVVWECMAQMVAGPSTLENASWRSHGEESFLAWRENPRLWLVNGGRAIANLRGRPLPECATAARDDWGVYGGSVAYGWGFATGERGDFAAQMEDLANAMPGGSTLRVHNLAWPGANLYAMFHRDGAYGFSRCLQGAIVSTHFNDAALGTEPPEWYRGETVSPPSFSLLARDLSAWLERYGPFFLGHARGPVPSTPERQEEWYALALRRFVERLRANGIERIVFLSEASQKPHPKTLAKGRVMNDVARSLGIPFTDAQALLDAHPDEPVYTDGLHLGRRGHRLIAQALLDAIDETRDEPDGRAGGAAPGGGAVSVRAPDRAPTARPAALPATMIHVPAGGFSMGSEEGDRDEKPVHQVFLDGFWIDETEVTVEAYRACVEAGVCPRPDEGGSCNWGAPGRDKHPVNCVDWSDADSFCRWAGKRLPTEAEWEKTARGTDGRKYPWGDEKPSCKRAVMDDGGSGCGRGSTWPVASKPEGATPYGVQDMAGNVWEWVADFYGKDAYEKSPERNPKGPQGGSRHVLRGGSWHRVPPSPRRLGTWYKPGGHDLGFRCARDEDAARD